MTGTTVTACTKHKVYACLLCDPAALAAVGEVRVPVDSQATHSHGSFLQRLRVASVSRLQRWHGADSIPWTGADWGNAMGGECGEAQNVIKKLRRAETGTASQNQQSQDALTQQLGDELADTIIYADLVAHHYGINLEEAIARKFNQISAREGFPERLAR